MFKLEIHKCDQNPVEVYVHKFKTEIKQKMMDDFRSKYATTYNSTKTKFLDSVPDPEFRELVCFELPSIVSVFVNICYCLTFHTMYIPLYDMKHHATVQHACYSIRLLFSFQRRKPPLKSGRSDSSKVFTFSFSFKSQI